VRNHNLFRYGQSPMTKHEIIEYFCVQDWFYRVLLSAVSPAGDTNVLRS